MKANSDIGSVSVTLSDHEALVLLEWLHNFNEVERPALFQDQVEERVLFDLEAELEKVVSTTFDEHYADILSKARQRIRDEK